MIRPDYVSEIKKYIQERNSNVAVGTVIGFMKEPILLKKNLQKLQKQLKTEQMNWIL
jgi:deoxyribose-phosphate aldolase